MCINFGHNIYKLESSEEASVWTGGVGWVRGVRTNWGGWRWWGPGGKWGPGEKRANEQVSCDWLSIDSLSIRVSYLSETQSDDDECLKVWNEMKLWKDAGGHLLLFFEWATDWPSTSLSAYVSSTVVMAMDPLLLHGVLVRVDSMSCFNSPITVFK